MTTQELIKALNRMKVQAGSLVCLGCGHEHNCGVHGCTVLREAVEQLRDYADCETCKHVDHCSEGCEPHIACNMGQNWEWDGGTHHER